MRETLGIPSELKLADLRRTAWTAMANKGATVPELAASAVLSMDTAAKSMDTYVVTSGPLADAGHGRREKNIKGTEKGQMLEVTGFFQQKCWKFGGSDGTRTRGLWRDRPAL